MQNQERNKKLLIIIFSMCLFGASYYYYVYKQDSAEQKPIKQFVSKNKTISAKISVSEPSKASKTKIKQQIKEEVTGVKGKIKKDKETQCEKKQSEAIPELVREVKNYDTKKIKPSTKADLVKTAINSSGKNDPFSYTESNFTQFKTTYAGSRGRKSGSLPGPPTVEKKPDNYVEIKGFLGNKVITEINGLTDSMSVGETLRGVKVISIDPVNLVCEFEIKGKKVARKMKPVTKPNKDVEINYLK